jgi:hypothetical protein
MGKLLSEVELGKLYEEHYIKCFSGLLGLGTVAHRPITIHVPINVRRERVKVFYWVQRQLRRKRGRPHYVIPYDQAVLMCLGAKYI